MKKRPLSIAIHAALFSLVLGDISPAIADIQVDEMGNPTTTSPVMIDDMGNSGTGWSTNIDDIDFTKFTPTSLSSLPASLMQQITAEKLAQIPPEAISGFTYEQIAELPPEAAAGFTKAQIENLPPAALNALTKEHVSYLTKEAVSGFHKDQLRYLTADAFSGLTAENFGGLSYKILFIIGIDILSLLPEDVVEEIPVEDMWWISKVNITYLLNLPDFILAKLPDITKTRIFFSFDVKRYRGHFEKKYGKKFAKELEKFYKRYLPKGWKVKIKYKHGKYYIKFKNKAPKHDLRLHWFKFMNIKFISGVDLEPEDDETNDDTLNLINALPTIGLGELDEEQSEYVPPETITNLPDDTKAEILVSKDLDTTPKEEIEKFLPQGWEIIEEGGKLRFNIKVEVIKLLPVTFWQRLTPMFFLRLQPSVLTQIDPIQLAAVPPEIIAELPEESLEQLPEETVKALPNKIKIKIYLKLKVITVKHDKFLPDGWEKNPDTGKIKCDPKTLTKEDLELITPEKVDMLDDSVVDGLTGEQINSLPPETVIKLPPEKAAASANSLPTDIRARIVLFFLERRLPVVQIRPLLPRGWVINPVNFKIEMSVDAARSLPRSIFAYLTPMQVGLFSQVVVMQFTAPQIRMLPPSAMPGFTLEQLASISGAAMAGFNPEQITGLNPQAVGGFASIQLLGLNADAQAAFTPEQKENLTDIPVNTTGGLMQNPSTGNCDGVCTAANETLIDLVVEEDASISNVVLEGNVDNKGLISQATVQPDAIVKGGTLSGTIENKGLIIDVTFKGALLIGGRLGGHIQNTSEVGGTFQDVSFEPNARLTGGVVIGIIKGDPTGLAVLEDVVVKSGSKLENVILGSGVRLEDGVEFKNVTFVEGSTDEKIDLPNVELEVDVEIIVEGADLTEPTEIGGTEVEPVIDQLAKVEEIKDFGIEQKNGVLQVKGEGEFEGVDLALVADPDKVIEAPEGAKPGITTDPEGNFVITTEAGIETTLFPAPKDPVMLFDALGADPAKDKLEIKQRGVTLLPVLGRGIVAAIFSPFIDIAPIGMEVGINFEADDSEGFVVYEDGTMQIIRPVTQDIPGLLLATPILAQTLPALVGVEYEFMATGEILFDYEDLRIKANPRFDITIEVPRQQPELNIIVWGELVEFITIEGKRQLIEIEIVGPAKSSSEANNG